MPVVSHHDQFAFVRQRRNDDEVTQTDRVEVVHQAPVREPYVLLKHLNPRFPPEEARGRLHHPVTPARRVTTPDQGRRMALHSWAIILLRPSHFMGWRPSFAHCS